LKENLPYNIMNKKVDSTDWAWTHDLMFLTQFILHMNKSISNFS